ncbi:MAG: exo-alpha-sialidase [Chloroflexi bacterium]|nr:exo-alpha-sialidase [Chloroflexota bacterium]
MACIQLLVGTTKGLFCYRADAQRQAWQREGPLLSEWSIDSILGDSRHGDRIFVGASHSTYGPAIQLSTDGGQHWTRLSGGPGYTPTSGRHLRGIWQITAGAPSQPDTYYAGVDEAGLFVSHDQGITWQEMEGIARHPDRAHWRPSRGGITLHAIAIDPTDPQRMWVAIASAGILRSEDGGVSWQACNQGQRIRSATDAPSYLPHKLALDPNNPNVLYLQNIDGVYCSTDGADSWQTIEAGLPSTFGFPFAVDHTGNQYVVPLDGNTRSMVDGRLCVYRRRATENGWQPLTTGLPTEPQLVGVLRDALTVDALTPAGVYMGTTQGELFYSADAGEHWAPLPSQPARITALQAWVTDRP